MQTPTKTPPDAALRLGLSHSTLRLQRERERNTPRANTKRFRVNPTQCMSLYLSRKSGEFAALARQVQGHALGRIHTKPFGVRAWRVTLALALEPQSTVTQAQT